MNIKKVLLGIVVMLVIIVAIFGGIKIVKYIEIRSEWNEELSLIEDTLLYSHWHDRFVFTFRAESYAENTITWYYTIREPKFDKRYNRYNFATDEGRFRPAKTRQYYYETERFIPTKLPQVSREISYEEFVDTYGFETTSLDRSGESRHIYIWDDKYILLLRGEEGRGELYSLETKEKVYWLDETYNYDSQVENSINEDTFPQILMTKDRALVAVYKKYNSLYLKVLN